MLLLPKFNYEEPTGMPEALRIFSELKNRAKVIAGGTDLLVNMKKGVASPEYLVSLRRIDVLRGIGTENTSIEIGSHVTVSELASSGMITRSLPALAAAATSLGSPLIRNRATIGGNIVTARPAADLPPVLIVLDAKVELKGKGKERMVALDDFFRGPGSTVMDDDEILTKIIIPEVPPFTGTDYMKLGHRATLEIAIVAVASRITLDKPDGSIKDARIVLSAVAPKAIHASSAERILIGERPSDDLIAEAAKLAMDDSSPIDDMRGGAAYRREMVGVLTKRTLSGALSAARGRQAGGTL
ncbi:MAG: xanthine dehydrogenase family protein subunit M [Syntrophorhabdus sp.]